MSIASFSEQRQWKYIPKEFQNVTVNDELLNVYFDVFTLILISFMTRSTFFIENDVLCINILCAVGKKTKKIEL